MPVVEVVDVVDVFEGDTFEILSPIIPLYQEPITW